MKRSQHCDHIPQTRAIRRERLQCGPKAKPPLLQAPLICADRKLLLLTTALASTLVIGSLAGPTPAAAVVTCIGDIGSGVPISHLAVADTIICVNTEARTNAAGNAISLQTIGNNFPVDLDNSGDLSATALGIISYTNGDSSSTIIVNSGDIAVDSVAAGFGISALGFGTNSPIDIVNSGDITVSAGILGFGIQAYSYAAGSSIDIVNSGDVAVTADTSDGFGVYARVYDADSPIDIVNSGDITVSAAGVASEAFGIYAQTGSIVADSDNSPITIVNSGDITVTDSGGGHAYGIHARTTFGGDSPLSLGNSGDIAVTAADSGWGINATTGVADPNNPLDLVNSGDIAVSAGNFGFGIDATTFEPDSPLTLLNSGDLTVTAAGGFSEGIRASAFDDDSPLSIVNSGDLTVVDTGAFAFGIDAYTAGDNNPIDIVNSGKIAAVASFASYGIAAETQGAASPISIVNSGSIDPMIGIDAKTYGPGSSISIENSGSVYGDVTGIVALSTYGTTSIVNTGGITAQSFSAIDAKGGSATILNWGLITGFVDLTDAADRFSNGEGGVFETKLISDFNGGVDLFSNAKGGKVLAATDGSAVEISSFEELERFENKGLITLRDGEVGDLFTISNTLGLSDLDFVASGKSRLAVDAFLGPPGSTADNFVINGDVSGKTRLVVNNTSPGPGAFNPVGIPVVYVNGNVSPHAFFLPKPIDTGFFNYDLFFKQSGGGIFELKSFLGREAFVLPQLITAAQDLWYAGSSTWFDRTVDLRVLLNGGPPVAYNPQAKYAEAALQGAPITPAVWVRGGGSWLDREGSESVAAYGRNYRYQLDRDLETMDFQMGLDLGKRGLLSPEDMLVFGVLGGFVRASLDYDQLVQKFDFRGGQVGGYATYLSGGLFVDTLLNAHLLELDPNAVFDNHGSLDANTVGLRTDTGYRFGSFSGGAFIEPLATIAVTWTEIESFSIGNNKASFDDDPSVRGRLGLRVGTSFAMWSGARMEPFIIGGVWGNLSDNNRATLVSTGTAFHLEDELNDVWGEVSAGLNFFNPSASTAIFVNVDTSFGEELEGVGGKAGMRVSW